MFNKIFDKIFEAIKKFDMIKENENIIVCVSGGADSMSLLHFLHKNSKHIGINNIIVAHVNHLLRGESSYRDELFVKNFCESNGITFHIKRIKVKEEAERMNLGLEECGRKKRYEFFNELSIKYNAKIATAHTLSDNIETVLLNLSRGTGLNGICGIPAVRDNIIRPLILVSREEIEQYCRDNELTFVTDMTNFSDCYNRNKIRLNVIPVLKKINSGFEESMSRTISSLIVDNNYLNKEAEKIKEKSYSYKEGGYDINILSKEDLSIRSRVVISIIKEKCKFDIEKAHINKVLSMIENRKGSINLPRNIYIYIENDKIKISEHLKKEKKLWEYKLKDISTLTEGGRKFIIRKVSIDEYNKMSDLEKECIYVFDNDSIPEGTIIRNRRDSDKIFIPYRKVTKSLKKLFNEEKVPVDKRDKLLILSNGDEILWIEGFKCLNKFKIKKETRDIIYLYETEFN